MAHDGECCLSIEVDRDTMDCEICQAVVRELSRTLDSKKTSKKGRETEVFQAIDKLCDMDHFRMYEYSPPTMLKGNPLLFVFSYYPFNLTMM
jgi:hypothetical protein